MHVWFVVWWPIQIVKYNYTDQLASAKDVPAWMIDARYLRLTDADILSLRGGECHRKQIFIRPMSDGRAVVTCCHPTKMDSVILYVVDTLDPSVLGMY